MTDRNDVIEPSIANGMGQPVPKVKANVSRDLDTLLGHSVQMGRAGDPEELAESRWREEFRQRIIDAQGLRSNEDMADLLGMQGPNRANTYGKYRTRGSMIPTRYLTKFCRICQVRLEWLLDGPPEERERSRRKEPQAASR